MSKGDKRRECQVSQAEYNQNWDNIYKTPLGTVEESTVPCTDKGLLNEINDTTEFDKHLNKGLDALNNAASLRKALKLPKELQFKAEKLPYGF